MKAGTNLWLSFFLLFCLVHFVPASRVESNQNRYALSIIKVSGKIDPHLQSIRRDRASSLQDRGGYPWRMRPETFGFTPPPKGDWVWFPGEFESTAGILLGWPSSAFDNAGRLKIRELRDIVRHSIRRTRVSIVVQVSIRPLIENTLRSAGLDPTRVEFITFPAKFPDVGNSRTLDTIWIRDYGPQFVYSVMDGRMDPHVIDMSYFPLRWRSRSDPLGRVRDDALPTRLADSLRLASYRPKFIAEGGDLLTDGRGTCFVTDQLSISNSAIFGAAHDSNEILSQYFGCQRVIILEGLTSGSGSHPDMFMAVLSPTTIFVGRYNPHHDQANAERLDRNAERLRAFGYNVIRIPMPRPYSIDDIRIWATFTNVARIQDAILVPVYHNPKFPEPLRALIYKQEAEALAKFRDALPGISVIPVVSDTLISAGGSLHCITINYGAKASRVH